MTPEIALLLAQDGISTGAIYVLVALGIVLIFLVTRVIFVPFGDVVGYSALTLAALQLRQLPGTVWLVLTLAALATVMEVYGLVRRGQMHRLPKALSLYAVLPAIPAALVWLAAGRDLPMWAGIALTLAIIIPISPLLYASHFARSPTPRSSSCSSSLWRFTSPYPVSRCCISDRRASAPSP
jgi:branched-chain amino acid transport system permease protein